MDGYREVFDIDKHTLPEVDWTYSMRRAMQQILPGLYLGPYGAASKSKLQELKDAGINHIVCVRCEQEKHVVKVNFPEVFQYLVVEMSDIDSEILIPKVKLFNKFIDECFKKNGNVLVYCMDGMSRGPALVIGYIMLKYGVNFKEGLKFVQNRRFCVQPSPVFEVQLKEFEPVCQALHIIPTASNGFKRSHEYSEREEEHSFTPSFYTKLREPGTKLEIPGMTVEEDDIDPDPHDDEDDSVVGHHNMDVEEVEM